MIFFYFVTASDPLGNGDSIWLDSANVAIFTEISSIFNKKYFSIVFLPGDLMRVGESDGSVARHGLCES